MQVLIQVVKERRGAGTVPRGVEAPIGDQFLTERMDRPDIHLAQIVRGSGAGAGGTQIGTQPLLELQGGLFGEGAEEDRLGLDALVHDQSQGAPEEDPGLTGTRPRRQKEGTGGMLDGLPLGLIWRESCCLVDRGDRHFALPWKSSVNLDQPLQAGLRQRGQRLIVFPA